MHLIRRVIVMWYYYGGAGIQFQEDDPKSARNCFNVSATTGTRRAISSYQLYSFVW